MVTSVFAFMVFITSIFHHCETQGREGPPLIEKFLEQKTFYFISGKVIRLPCVASGGNITYYWKQNDKIINPENQKNFKLQSGTLYIDTSSDSEGKYRCYAKNNFGISVSENVTLIQSVLKFLNKDDTKIENYIGFPHQIYCEHDSVPRSNVRWFKNKDPLTLNDRLLTDDKGTLYFTSLNNDDDGEYTCHISNAVNAVMNGINGAMNLLSVKEGTEKPPKTDLMWASPSSPIGFLGESLTLKCIFSGKDVSIKWSVSSKNEKGHKSKGFELVLTELDGDDEGEYKCQCDRQDHKFNIKIFSRPEWRKKPKSVQKKFNSSVEFICEADGNPKPTTHWFINTQPIKDFLQQNKDRDIYKQIHYQGYKISIKALTLRDMMTIQCLCKNEYGNVFTNVYISVLDNPTSTALTTKIPNTVDPGSASITTSHQITSCTTTTTTTTKAATTPTPKTTITTTTTTTLPPKATTTPPPKTTTTTTTTTTTLRRPPPKTTTTTTTTTTLPPPPKTTTTPPPPKTTTTTTTTTTPPPPPKTTTTPPPTKTTTTTTTKVLPPPKTTILPPPPKTTTAPPPKTTATTTTTSTLPPQKTTLTKTTPSSALKNDEMSQESQAKVGAPVIGGAVGGLTVLMLIGGIVVFWRCRSSKNKYSDPQDVTAFNNGAYEKNGNLPAKIRCIPSRASTYDTLDSSLQGKGDTYEQLHAHDSLDAYLEISDGNINARVSQTRSDNINEDIYDVIDDSQSSRKKPDVKDANLYFDLENGDNKTAVKTNINKNTDNYFSLEKQNVVSGEHSTPNEPVVNDENVGNYFTLEKQNVVSGEHSTPNEPVVNDENVGNYFTLEKQNVVSREYSTPNEPVVNDENVDNYLTLEKQNVVSREHSTPNEPVVNDENVDNYFTLEKQNVVSGEDSTPSEPLVNDENYFILEATSE